MTFDEIKQQLILNFGNESISSIETGPQPILVIPVEKLVEVCHYLHENDQLYFDLLACITAIDNGPGLATMELIYNLTSIPYEHDLMLKIVFARNVADQPPIRSDGQPHLAYGRLARTGGIRPCRH